MSGQEKLTEGNYFKNIDARVTNLVHDTSSHQGLSIHEVSFHQYKQKLGYCKIKKCVGKSVTDRTERQTDGRTERNFDSIIILVSMATERKKLKKDLKIFSSRFSRNFTRSISGIRGTNDMKQNFDFIIILVAMTTERKKPEKNT